MASQKLLKKGQIFLTPTTFSSRRPNYLRCRTCKLISNIIFQFRSVTVPPKECPSVAWYGSFTRETKVQTISSYNSQHAPGSGGGVVAVKTGRRGSERARGRGFPMAVPVFVSNESPGPPAASGPTTAAFLVATLFCSVLQTPLCSPDAAMFSRHFTYSSDCRTLRVRERKSPPQKKRLPKNPVSPEDLGP